MPNNPDDKKNPVGRVRHEAGGRAIWEWAVDTGRHALDSTSRLLKRLDLPGLSLLDEEAEKRKQAEEEQAGKDVPTFGGQREADPMGDARRSFNPYDNRAPPKRGAASKPAGKPAPRITQPAPKPRGGFFSRLFGKK